MFTPYENRRSPEQKVGVLVFIFDFFVLWYYFFSGTTALRPMASVFWIASALAGMLLFHIRSIPLTSYMSLCILGFVGICISIPTSVDVTISAKYALSIVLFFLVAYQITRPKANMPWLLAIMMAFSLLLVAVTYIQAFVPEVYNSFFLPIMPSRFHERILTFMSNKAHTGLYNQTSSNAVTMSMGCCLCMYYLDKCGEEHKMRKLLSAITLIVFAYGLILTNRRGSSVTIAVLFVFFVIGRMRNPVFKAIVIFVIGGFVLSGAWKDISVIENLLNKSEVYAAEGDITNGRIAIWGESLQIFRNNPLTGCGADMFGYVATAGYAHNSYLQSLTELGLVGMILFYVPFLYGFRKTMGLYMRRHYLSQQERCIVTFCFVWQLYCFINALFESFFATEVSVFMLYIVQMMCIRIEENFQDAIYGQWTENAEKW